jgi:hypothetical protein
MNVNEGAFFRRSDESVGEERKREEGRQILSKYFICMYEKE